MDKRGNVLAFSGELFAGVAVGSGAENDAAALLANFDEVFAKAPNDEGLAASALVAELRGPWALAYWHEQTQRLWFGRDVFGRRSLLLRRGGGRGSSARDGDAARRAPRPTTLTLTSVAPERAADDPDVPDPDVPEDEEKTEETDEWEELEPGLYGVDLRAAERENDDDCFFLLPAATRAAAPPPRGALPERLLRFRRARAATRPAVEKTNDSSAHDETETNTARDAAVDGFVAALSAAVERRVALSVVEKNVFTVGRKTTNDDTDAAFIGVLFSGGVDSMLLAALAHRHVPNGRAVDLINVCFDEGNSPDRAAALDGVAELEALFPSRAFRLVRVDADVAEADAAASRLASLLTPARTVMDRNIGAALWFAARGEGCLLYTSPSPRDKRQSRMPSSA